MRIELLITSFCIMAAAGSVMAQPQGSPDDSTWGRHRTMMHARNGLKLTDEQKATVQKIRFGIMQKQIDLRAQIAHDRLDYERLASAETPDESAIADKLDDIAKLQVQIRKNLLDGWFAINKILTPDQQKIWKKVLQHPGMAMQKRRMMIRMRTNGRNGMMQMRKQRLGVGPMTNEGPMLGEGLDNDPGADDMDYLGSTADADILFDDDSSPDDVEMFDAPMMDNMDITGSAEFMRNRAEMMKDMMNRSPEEQTPDSSK
ncbi:MAG TPA: periplasmic heavy metal sensor [Candidatus Acidoferrales bacterium]|nr:periplasmic heavy metal sensor [Candidatus Acidoferrales bacterium]